MHRSSPVARSFAVLAVLTLLAAPAATPQGCSLECSERSVTVDPNG
ncbi:MAG: hypothetical protein ACLF0P_12500 [Thermoanaerobaculia bacterium]